MAVTSARAAMPFRPTSMGDFTRYARSVARILGATYQQALQLLAQFYGHANYEALTSMMASPGTPGPFDNLMPLTVPADLREVLADAKGTEAPRELLNILAPEAMARAVRLVETMAECKGRDGVPPDQRRVLLVVSAGLFCTPLEHRLAMQDVEKVLQELGDEGPSPLAMRLNLRGLAAMALNSSREVSLLALSDQAWISDDDPDNGLPSLCPERNATRAVVHRICRSFARLVEHEHDACGRSGLHPLLAVWREASTDFLKAAAPPTLEQLLVTGGHVPPAMLSALAPGRADAPDAEQQPKAYLLWHEALRQAVRVPSEAAASAHPLLRQIPDVGRFVQQWPMQRFLARMRGWEGPNEDVYAWQSQEDDPVRWRCIVSVKEHVPTKHEDRAVVRIHGYRALLCYPITRGNWFAVGHMEGQFVELLPSRLTNDALFIEVLSRHSAQLRRVARDLVLDFDPQGTGEPQEAETSTGTRRKPSVRRIEFTRRQLRPWNTVVTVTPTIAVDARGHSALETMLRAFRDTLVHATSVARMSSQCPDGLAAIDGCDIDNWGSFDGIDLPMIGNVVPDLQWPHLMVYPFEKAMRPYRPGEAMRPVANVVDTVPPDPHDARRRRDLSLRLEAMQLGCMPQVALDPHRPRNKRL